MSQQDFQGFLNLIHHYYPPTRVSDRARLHTAKTSTQLARRLHVELIWLSKQCPELNCADQLFKCLKADVAANHQYPNIEQHAKAAESYLQNLTPKQALRKAGMKSKNFWAKKYNVKKLLLTHLDKLFLPEPAENFTLTLQA